MKRPQDQRDVSRALGEMRRQRRTEIGEAEISETVASDDELTLLSNSPRADLAGDTSSRLVYIFRPTDEQFDYNMAAGGGHNETRNVSFRAGLGMQLSVSWDDVSLQLVWRHVSNALNSARLLVRFKRDDGKLLRPDVLVPTTDSSWPRPRQSPGFDTRGRWTLEIVALVESEQK